MAEQQTQTRQNGSGAEETTPLLASEARAASQSNEGVIHKISNGNASLGVQAEDPTSEPDDDIPLPKLQIFILCYCGLIEPVSYFCIFPFVNQMIEDVGGIPEKNVGFWSGTIESLFSLTQMLLMLFYGRASDRIGRKPVLVFSLAGVSIATSLFGMSKTLWQMILFRCLAGVFAGCSVTIRALLTENCTYRTQARAFSFFAFSRNLGIFLGPLIGGSLSSPATQYKSIFGHNEFLKEHPYALPTLTTGAISISATILSALFVKETLNRKVNGKTVKGEPMSTWELIKSPGVATVLYIFSHACLLGVSFTAVIPVFLYTSVGLGGFGFEPKKISIFLAVIGASQALWILLVFPPLQRKFSTGTVLRFCALIWPLMFLLFPLGNILLRHNLKIPFWITLPIMTIGGSGVSMAFTCVQLNLNDIAPSPATLGTLNGLALTFNSAIRAVAPALFTTIFATGVKINFIDGHLVWIALVLVAGTFAIGTRCLPEKAEGRIKRVEDSA